jgi:hypothetical protein
MARLYLLTPRIRYSGAYRQARASTRAFFLTSRDRWPVFADPNPDPDPSDPHVFGPPGSGSGSISPLDPSFYHKAKILRKTLILTSVADPDPGPPDPHVFGSPGSGSTSQRYGSVSGSFYHHAKILRKTLIPTIL